MFKGPKIKPTIPKELEPLAREARKYESAKEFVKAIGEKHKVYLDLESGNIIPVLQDYTEHLNNAKTELVKYQEVLKNVGLVPIGLSRKAILGRIRYAQDEIKNWQPRVDFLTDLKNRGIISLVDFYNQAVKGIKVESDMEEKPNVKDYLEQGKKSFGKLFYPLEKYPIMLYLERIKPREFGYWATKEGEEELAEFKKKVKDYLKEKDNPERKLKGRIKVEEEIKPAIPKELEPLAQEARKIAAKYPDTPEGLKAGAEEFGKVFYRLPIVKDISRQGIAGEYSKLVIRNIVETRATKLTGAEIYASITNPVGTNDFTIEILKRVGATADKLGDFYLTPELKILKEKNPYEFNRLIEGKLLFSSEDGALNYLKNIFPSAAYKLDLARNISRNPEFLTDFYNQVVKEVKEVKPAIPEGLEPLKKVEVAEVPKELEKKLETPFRHSTWFQEVRGGKVVPYLTKKEALERLAKLKDVTMYETEKPIPGRPLLAPGEKVFYLTDGKYKYRLSPAEKAYWDKLKALEVKETKEVKPEDSSPNPVTEEEILEIRDWLDKLRKKYKIKPGEWLSDKIVLEEFEKEKNKPKIYREPIPMEITKP